MNKGDREQLHGVAERKMAATRAHPEVSENPGCDPQVFKLRACGHSITALDGGRANSPRAAQDAGRSVCPSRTQGGRPARLPGCLGQSKQALQPRGPIPLPRVGIPQPPHVPFQALSRQGQTKCPLSARRCRGSGDIRATMAKPCLQRAQTKSIKTRHKTQ